MGLWKRGNVGADFSIKKFFSTFYCFQKVGFGAEFLRGDSESTKLNFFGRNRILWIKKRLEFSRKTVLKNSEITCLNSLIFKSGLQSPVGASEKWAPPGPMPPLGTKWKSWNRRRHHQIPRYQEMAFKCANKYQKGNCKNIKEKYLPKNLR